MAFLKRRGTTLNMNSQRFKRSQTCTNSSQLAASISHHVVSGDFIRTLPAAYFAQVFLNSDSRTLGTIALVGIYLRVNRGGLNCHRTSPFVAGISNLTRPLPRFCPGDCLLAV